LGLALLTVKSKYRKFIIVLQLPGVLAFLILYFPLLWPPSNSGPSTQGLALTFATYNIAPNADANRAANVIAALDADVIGLQEIGPASDGKTIADRLAISHPYQIMRTEELERHTGIGLLSRYPVLDQEIFQPVPAASWHIRAVLDVNGTSVVVYVAHPRAPRPLPPYKYDDSELKDDLSAVLERIQAETGPVVLLCDCNMTDQSDIYHKTTKQLDDAFHEVGWGMGLTSSVSTLFPWMPPITRIDYIWYNDAFAARKAFVWDSAGSSDHRPVIARLQLRDHVE
jgi:vancomycin resistance protein VanJ